MKSKWILLILSLLAIVIVSGCGRLKISQPNGPPPIEYDDNALTLEGYKVQTRVFPGQKTWIEFWLTNNVEYDVENVYVRFYNPSVFELTKEDIECSGGDKLEDGCYFEKIQSLDAKRIHVVLKAPSKEEIGELEETYKVQFSVKYDYDGESVCYFRILNKEEEETETEMQLTQTVGPIHIEIDPGFVYEQIEDGRKTKISDWAIEGMPFSIKITGENVGKSKKGYEYPDITLDSFEMTLRNVIVDEDDIESCDFDYDNNILTKDDIVISEEEKFVPLVCILTPEEGFTEPEISGIIKADYSYRYEFRKTEMITIGME